MSTATAHVRAEDLISDLKIELWVHERYGFVPHPFWIRHCEELYLGWAPGGSRKPWHECPADKRQMIREAFRNFGMLPE